ncbi:InlB B-repeat-containing protein [Paenibacillus qinlingensis]|uniref:InlB B-repeat-containing protein n=1 Tax=Paenibacillus qinlingensis TaxID=1837343 RepID=UPI00156696F4|nr:glycoside hydrolase family 9 protein [Paenibacillus qinlingensis]NQX59958.1 glycoside hydrolase family 9 protein [Paenibacillus qinlingensis]
MVKTNTRRILTFLIITIACILFSTSGSTAFALKERAPIAPEPKVSYASVINSQWMEICLVDNPYSDAHVTNTDYYTITSNDDPNFSGGVTPILVNYRYFPEQAPYSPTLTGNIGKIQVFYRSYLKIPSTVKFKEGKTYTISINSAVANAGPLTFKFDDTKPNLVIHSNQVGYLSEGSKISYLSLWTGQGSIDFSDYKKFYVIDENTGKSVYTGDIILHLANDRWTKSDIYAMDFSQLKAEGRYHLYIPGIGISYPFDISSSIYKEDIGYTITRALFAQRDGNHGLDNPAYTHWNRPPAHLDDGIDQALYMDNGNNLQAARVDLVGGHMDAGDRGKYPYNSAYVGIDMLMGAKYFSSQIKAQGESLEIPESGNGKPDYLDELVYELDWLNKAIMNTSTDGALTNYLRPQSNDPTTGTYETNVPLVGALNRMFYNRTQGPNKAETLFAAGVMAQAYNTPLMQEYYPEKSKQYLKAALRAYNGFKLHYQDPDYLKEGTYYDVSKEGTPHSWSNEMLLAASALMVATGDVEEFMPWINSEMATNLINYNSIKHWNWVLDRVWLGTFVSMYENPYISQTLRQWAYGGIINYAESEMNHQTPFGASAQDEGFPNLIGWRFTSANLMPVVVGYGVTQNPLYLERIQKTWDYTLGSNAVSRSFITGLGDPQRSPRWFVNEINQYQWVQHAQGNGGWIEPPPGFPGSDIQSAPYPSWFNDAGNTIAKTKVFPSYNEHAVMYRYTDSWNTQNEYSVNILSANAVSMLPLIPVNTYDLTVNSVEGDVFPVGGSYSQGMQLTLTAKGKPGYKFDHWSGDVSGTQSPVTVTMDTYKNVTANYVTAAVYAITVNAENGKVTQDNPDGNYSDGDMVTLTVEADYGYKFVGWSGDVTGTEASIQVTMNANKNITAQFVPLSQYSLSITSQNGIVKINPMKALYMEGEDVILTAVKNFGYKFSGWSGDFTGLTNPAIVNMDGNQQITANFTAVPTYPLAINATEGGNVATAIDSPANVSGGLYEEGALVTLTATAKPGFLFTGWSGDLLSSSNPMKFSVDGSKTLTANFKPTSGLISVDVTPTGTSGATQVNNGVYTLTSSGNKFGVAPDSFRYLLRAGLKGDAVFSAKLDALTTDNPTEAVAGIQIRTNLADDSTYAAIMVKNGKLVVQIRKGGAYFDTYPLAPVDTTLPVWLQITRNINRDIILSWSSDGVNWNIYNTSTFWGWNDPNVELTVGLFTSAVRAGKSATAQFSQVIWPSMQNLTINSGPGGTAAPESGLYVANSQVKLTATPDEGYAFAGWSDGLSGKANPAYITMNGNKTVTANFSLMPAICILTVPTISGGTLVFDPPGGAYAPNTIVKVTAIPDSGNSFVYWEGDLVGSENPVYLKMDGHKTISAKFVSYESTDITTTYVGNTIEDGNGTTINASGLILWGENDSFRYVYEDNQTGDTAIIAKVTEFNAISGNARAGIMVRQGTSVQSNYQGIFITHDKKIRSQFRNGNKWTIAEYTGTEAVTLPIWLKVEKQGTKLTTYSSVDGQIWVQRGSQTIATFTNPFTVGLAVTAGQDGKFVTAKFSDINWQAEPSTDYALLANAVHGTISTNPSGITHAPGTLVTVTATASAGYTFNGWSGDLNGTTNPATITMDSNKTITANFVESTTQFTLTTQTEHGTITLDPASGSYNVGTLVTLTAVPSAGYVFSGWSGDLSGAANPATLVMNANKTVTATYVPAIPQQKYTSVDIGTTYTGTTSQLGGLLTVKGSGANIWGQSDNFRYVHQDNLTGDATIIAKINGMSVLGTNANSNTKIGVMIRQNTDANSVHQGIFIDGTKKIKSIYRDSVNGWAGKNYDGTALETLPIWLKIEKIGNTVKTYSSTDGVLWTERSSRILSFTGRFTVGLAVSSGTDSKFAEATLSNVTVHSFNSADIGTTYTGTTSQAGSTVTVKGSGTNIWGQSDNLRYVYRDNLTGDATIVAKIAGMTMIGASANSNTKIGIMLRQSSAANSAHHGIFIDGAIKVKSIYREYTNGWAGKNYDGTTVETLPIWLKVEKIGNTIKTYTSAEGTIWTLRSSRNITFTGPFTAGLAVSSGTDSKFAEVTFDNVMWP